MVADCEKLDPYHCWFESHQGLWILSCQEAIDDCTLVPACTRNNAQTGTRGLHPPSLYSVGTTKNAVQVLAHQNQRFRVCHSYQMGMFCHRASTLVNFYKTNCQIDLKFGQKHTCTYNSHISICYYYTDWPFLEKTFIHHFPLNLKV